MTKYDQYNIIVHRNNQYFTNILYKTVNVTFGVLVRTHGVYYFENYFLSS